VKKILLISLALFSFTNLAMAAVAVPYGWYVEGNVGKSNVSAKNYPGKDKNSGVGASVNAGYKFTPFIAGEIGITHYEDTKILTNTNATVAKDKHYSYDIAGKLMLPVGGTGVEVFGKLGLGRTYSKVRVTNPGLAAVNNMAFDQAAHTTSGLYMAAGMDYAVMPNVLANLQWARQKGSSHSGNLDLYSLGLAYIF
jgi:opacity protein-like surface antigen